jgi:hypothetical protein
MAAASAPRRRLISLQPARHPGDAPIVKLFEVGDNHAEPCELRFRQHGGRAAIGDGGDAGPQALNLAGELGALALGRGAPLPAERGLPA